MSDKIKHAGIIDTIDTNNHVRVRIVQTSACASCKVASHCNASEAKEKIVDVFTDGSGLTIGQEVVVTASRDVAGRALALGFGLPLILMTAVLVATLLLTGSEGLAALLALSILLPYYGTIWLLRDKIAQRISFQIEETNKTY